MERQHHLKPQEPNYMALYLITIDEDIDAGLMWEALADEYPFELVDKSQPRPKPTVTEMDIADIFNLCQTKTFDEIAKMYGFNRGDYVKKLLVKHGYDLSNRKKINWWEKKKPKKAKKAR